MMKIKVLWFDDEFAELEQIVEEANEVGIELIGFKNAKLGLEELKDNRMQYDAILVDGLFLKGETNVEKKDNQAFGEVAQYIKLLKTEGYHIPWFILSGQSRFVEDDNDLVKILADKDFANGKIFDKNQDEDLIELWQTIRKYVELNEFTEQRTEHKQVLAAFELGLMPQAKYNVMLQLLVLAKNGKSAKQDYNLLRELFEEYLLSLNRNGILPDSLIKDNGKPNLEFAHRFLSGLSVDDRRSRPPVIMFPKNPNPVYPEHISRLADCIKQVSSMLSHTYNHSFSKYAFSACVMGFAELIVWYQEYAKSNHII